MDDQIRPKREKPFRLRPRRSNGGALMWVLEVNSTGELVAWGWSVSECLKTARSVIRSR